MTTPERPGPPRAPLTRERIVAAAIELADAHGVDGLSMRKLAAKLGFEVMSLYNHVADKDDLLDGMVDRVAGDIAGAPAGEGWKPAARTIAMSAHDTLLRHQWATALWLNRWPGPNRWRHMETLLSVLADAGLPEELADLGFHAITFHIQGFTQQQLSYAMDAPSEDELYARFETEAIADEIPHVVDHMRYHRESQPSHDEFAFVLDLILDGLERSTTPG